MAGLAREVEKLMQQQLAAFCWRAKVVSATATTCTVQRYVGDVNVVCALLSSYAAPVADDEVLVLYTSGGNVVLGKVLR